MKDTTYAAALLFASAVRRAPNAPETTITAAETLLEKLVDPGYVTKDRLDATIAAAYAVAVNASNNAVHLTDVLACACNAVWSSKTPEAETEWLVRGCMHAITAGIGNPLEAQQ